MRWIEILEAGYSPSLLLGTRFTPYIMTFSPNKTCSKIAPLSFAVLAGVSSSMPGSLPLPPPLTGEHLGYSTPLLKGGNSCPQGNALTSCHIINEELGGNSGEGAWRCGCPKQEAAVLGNICTARGQGFGETPGSLGKNVGCSGLEMGEDCVD